MINNIELGVNETYTTITFNVKNSAGTAVNITGYTIRFKIRKHNATSNTNDAANSCTLTNPTGGVCTYTFSSTDLPSSGDYYAQLQITHPNTSVHIVPIFVKITAIEKY